jgi:uncharacterized protein YkwD
MRHLPSGREVRVQPGPFPAEKETVGSSRRICVAVLVCLACLGGASIASAADDALLAPVATCPSADQLNLDQAAAQQSMLCLTNWARTQSGLPALQLDTTLNDAGRAKLAADVSCGEFTHTPCGNAFSSVFSTYLSGARGYQIGENIAWGTGHYGTPRETMNGWLQSPGHRANILTAAFRDLGIGYLPNQTFQGYSGAALWSQEFGVRDGQAAATTTQPAATAKKKPALRKHRR